MSIRTTCSGILLALYVFLFSGIAHAQEQHPNYIHALSDLKTARWLLLQHMDGRDMTHNEKEALRQINEVIREINAASTDDGLGPDGHLKVKEGRSSAATLQQCLEFLRTAKDDLGREEDGHFAGGLRDRSTKNCDAIIKFVERIK